MSNDDFEKALKDSEKEITRCVSLEVELEELREKH